MVDAVKEIKALTTKEIKALARPDFEQNPEKYYPVETFKKLGFSRNRCKCGHYYWRRSEKQDNCGDSNCVGKYTFIGKGTGIGTKGKRITYAEAWKGFERSLTSSRVPCTSIERYPVVARWRNDVDYVAAGIFCFQPYCVTGELDPPANPLICPQFCVRFNDLDNIGLTGRHYSGFIMLGIQVFNYPDKFVFFKDECVEFNYRWLTDELGINPEEITFIEDVWAGGGNLGPSIEYFVNGLELGNMVFMQYKTFHDGSKEELPIKIIDTGIGLERVGWLINGSATSYMDTFKNALEFLSEKLNIQINNEIWEKFGPYSCRLNIDEVDNIDDTWELISKEINVDVETVKKAIAPVKDMYIILDHSRSVFMIIYDGSLPSNVGGGANVRNILRRIFAILKKNNWLDLLKIEGLVELMIRHTRDLEGIFGEFKISTNLKEIIQLEFDKWIATDDTQKDSLNKLLKKKKGELTIDDWIVAMQSWGLPADTIAEISKKPIPGNLYYEIAQRLERIVKAQEQIHYDTHHLKETENIFYADHHQTDFDATIIEVFENKTDKNFKNKHNIIIFDRTCFYPTSGGQQHDTGFIIIGDEKYEVLNVEKVGKCNLHILDRELKGDAKSYIGKSVHGQIDLSKRFQLMCHHTGTHVVFAAARRVLGQHIWQNGAKKTVDQAHLDITHYRALTEEEKSAIENEANNIIMSGKNIKKYYMDKAEAERNFGFTLYQGGVVPGNSLRIVEIEKTDVEACCGTHHDNTSQVGFVKILKSHRISDGIVRLYFVAYQKALNEINEENRVITKMCKLFSVERTHLIETGQRFFDGYKKFQNRADKLEVTVIDLQVKLICQNPDIKIAYILSEKKDPSIYFSYMDGYAPELAKHKKGIIFYNDKFVYGLIGDKTIFNDAEFKQVLEESKSKNFKDKVLKLNTKNSVKVSGTAVNNILSFSAICPFNLKNITDFFTKNNYNKL